ncbi:MAG TPA: D-alanyl-D-alanine carboxypeptidase, partial [Ornithinibacter sp.]|nr:D-alanyl-D-alanine carboxypeptidase [Ornithinibacter sp.]
MRRVMLASLAVLVATTGYVAADVMDVAPGILTLDRPVAIPTPTVSGTPAPVLLPSPAPAASDDSLLTSASTAAPVPTAEGLAAALGGASDDPALKGGVGISVRDAITGDELYALDADRPRVPASTAKLFAALAVADTLDLRETMATRVVAAPGSSDLVLVAGGDTLLAPGKG